MWDDFEDQADVEYDRFQDGYYYEDDPEIEFDDDEEALEIMVEIRETESEY